MLTNALTCLEYNASSDYFNCLPPTFEDYVRVVFLGDTRSISIHIIHSCVGSDVIALYLLTIVIVC
jgi:hypothetical protein